MPIYEYECLTCGMRFEKLVLGSASALTCPRCQGAELQKLPSIFAQGGQSLSESSGGSGSGGCAGCSSGNCGSCGCG